MRTTRVFVATLAVTLGVVACTRGAGPKAEPPASSAKTAAQDCEGLAAIDEVWTAERRSALATHLAQVPGEWPKLALNTLMSRVELGREDWLTRYAAACEAGRSAVRGCLETQLWGLDALIDVLLDGPPARAASLWSEIDRSLVGLDDCEHESREREGVPREISRELEHLELLANLDSSGLAARVKALAADPRIAADLGSSLQVMSLELRVELAERDWEAVNEVLGRMRAAAARLLGTQAARTQVAMAVYEAFVALFRGQAEAAVEHADRGLEAARAERADWVRFHQLHALVKVYANVDREAAISLLEETIALATRIAGVRSPITADLQYALAQVYAVDGEAALAYEQLSQARNAMAASLGVDHPVTLTIAEETAELLVSMGRYEDAVYALSDLLQIREQIREQTREQARDQDDEALGRTRAALGSALVELGKFDEARDLYRAALEPLTAALGPTHRLVAATQVNLGIIELNSGSIQEAATHCSEGLRFALSLPEDDPLRTDAAACMARVRMARARDAR